MRKASGRSFTSPATYRTPTPTTMPTTMLEISDSNEACAAANDVNT